ncbi:hypothetical protein BU15DRAFT_64635 [Melanogaster broomeanus]|nr:hypothetical protein BU15DRAFT_64635 [Melanogaster broomeanus]
MKATWFSHPRKECHLALATYAALLISLEQSDHHQELVWSKLTTIMTQTPMKVKTQSQQPLVHAQFSTAPLLAHEMVAGSNLQLHVANVTAVYLSPSAHPACEIQCQSNEEMKGVEMRGQEMSRRAGEQEREQ